MKIFIIAVVALIFSNQLFSQEFDYEKLGFDLQGVVHANGKIIAYGYSGHVLVSSDKGENWTSMKIFEDDKNITKMIYYDDNFYGICFEGIIFKTDFELNVLEQMYESLNYYDFDLEKDLYVVASNSSVKVFNLNLSQTNEIPIDTSNHISRITYFKEHLYLPTNAGNVVDVNLYNNNIVVSIIDVSFVGKDVRQIIPKQNSLILNVDNKAIELDIKTKDIKPISDGVTLLNYDNNELYDLRTKTNDSKNIAWIELYKYENDVFNLITQDSTERYVTPRSLNIRNYIFLNSNDAIAVGKNKTIYISNSKGVNWELISMLNSDGPNKWISGKIGFQVCPQGQMCKTINGGITWLPQLYTDTLIKYTQGSGGFESAFYMNDKGVGFYWFATSVILPPRDSAKFINTLYTDDFGETYKSTWDWGFLSKFYSRKFASQFEVELIDFNNSIITSIVPQSGDATKNNLTDIFEIDPLHQLSKRTKIDSVSIVGITVFDDKLYALMWERRYPCKDVQFCFDSTKKWIASSIDNGKNWNFEFECKIDGNFINWMRFKKDNIFLIESIHQSEKVNIDSGFTPYSQYVIDIKSKQCKLIYRDSSYFNNATHYYENSCYLIMLYKDYIYLRTKEYDLLKCSISDINSPKWGKTQLSVNDSLLYNQYNFNDSILYGGNYKYYLKKPTSVVEEQVENERYVFGVPPFPQPASSYVTFQFYLGNKVNSSECSIEIYDIYGNKKNFDRHIESYLLSNNLIEFKWNTENAESGIYMVKFSNKHATNFTKVIVVK